jgi:hypothetical protein
MQRECGQCFIQVEAVVVDRLRAMRGPCESYSDVILRFIELELLAKVKANQDELREDPDEWLGRADRLLAPSERRF